MKYILFFLGLTSLILASCQNPNEQKDGAGLQKSFKDWHTQSNADEVKLTHLSLNIEVDFRTKEIKGTATWYLDSNTKAAKIILDTHDLTIDSVRYADGTPANFTLEAPVPILGSALRIDLKPHTKSVTIFYKTGKDATALQWLNPVQTFGKRQPFLYTQSESIYARSWIPCMDGPGIRFTYDATVKVPKGLLALMSARNPQKKSENGIYHFEMDQPIPAYLMALAVGDIGFKAADSRTGVYAEPVILNKAYNELDEIGKMVHTAERLYGPYRWGRYDVLILPSGFPMGGMENPRLTFCTPTILAGDKSLVNLIAHELAHSWSGNLVTNATWNDFWINEGFTDYFERRITEATYGKDYVDMQWELGYQALKANVAQLGENSRDTWLKMDLKGRDPDIGFTDIPYEKGSAFLRLIEQTVGRSRFDQFLRKYFDHFAFQTMTTERFLDYLNKNLLNGHSQWENAIKIKEWVYGPGIPANYPRPDRVRFAKVEEQLKAFLADTSASRLKTKGWSPYEWIHFLQNIPVPVNKDKMKDLDTTFHFTQTYNSEVADVWFLLSIQSNYTEAFPTMKDFLYHTGREKFLEPLYRALMKTPKGERMAKDIYDIARPNYHPLAQKDIDNIIYSK